MPARATLRHPQFGDLILTLQGDKVVIGEGDARVVQALDSERDARDHFERTIQLRKRSGYALVETKELAEEDVRPPDALESEGFEGKIEHASGVWSLVFHGDAGSDISLAVCRALVDRMRVASPRTVQLSCDFASPGRAWEEALAGVTVESIESFVFDTAAQTQTRQRENSIGDLGAVLAACKSLRRLFATGELLLSPVTHRELRALHLCGDPLSLELASALGKSSLPSLERLVLSFASDAGPLDDEAMLEAILSLRAPRLRELHLASIGDVPAFLARLADRGLPASWKTLSIAGTWAHAYDNEDVSPVLEVQGEAFRTLDALGLAVDDEASLRAFAPVKKRDAFADLFLPKAYSGW